MTNLTQSECIAYQYVFIKGKSSTVTINVHEVANPLVLVPPAARIAFRCVQSFHVCRSILELTTKNYLKEKNYTNEHKLDAFL